MSTKALDYLEKDKITNASMINIIRRNSAEIIEEGEEGVLLKDTISNVYMISCKNDQTGIEWLKRGPEIKILECSSEAIHDWVLKNLGLSESVECFQFVYLKDQIEKRKNSKLEIRRVTKEELDIVQNNYDKLTKEELHEICKRGNLYMGTFCGERIGFIGNHLEGSIGMLEVFPNYRKNGFATDLEIFMIEHSLKEGQIPYGHVITDNNASFQLQQKVGMQLAKKKIYWIF